MFFYKKRLFDLQKPTIPIFDGEIREAYTYKNLRVFQTSLGEIHFLNRHVGHWKNKSPYFKAQCIVRGENWKTEFAVNKNLKSKFQIPDYYPGQIELETK